MKKMLISVFIAIAILAVASPCFAAFGQVCYGYGCEASDGPRGSYSSSSQQNNNSSTARDALRK